MRKLALFALAASAAFLPSAVHAQVTVPGPVVVPPGTTFQGGSFQGNQFVQFPPQIQRGFFVPPMWLGPQFHINNWPAYGFSAPPAGHRWVRYYNDAYLVDQQGRVVETRTGLDWDRYGERWNSNGGIPHYEGRGEFHPGERDYAWVQQQGGQGGAYPGYANVSGPAYTMSCGPGCQQVMPQGCGGTTYSYGCGGYGYPIIIETTTTSGCCSSCCVEEVVEEVVEVREAPRRRYRAPPRRVRRAPPPRPRPPAGERG